MTTSLLSMLLSIISPTGLLLVCPQSSHNALAPKRWSSRFFSAFLATRVKLRLLTTWLESWPLHVYFDGLFPFLYVPATLKHKKSQGYIYSLSYQEHSMSRCSRNSGLRPLKLLTIFILVSLLLYPTSTSCQHLMLSHVICLHITMCLIMLVFERQALSVQSYFLLLEQCLVLLSRYQLPKVSTCNSF